MKLSGKCSKSRTRKKNTIDITFVGSGGSGQTELLGAKVIYRICFPEKTVKWLKAHYLKKNDLVYKDAHETFQLWMFNVWFAEFSSRDFLPSSYKDTASDRQLQRPKEAAKHQESLSNKYPT